MQEYLITLDPRLQDSLRSNTGVLRLWIQEEH
ncbi:hypothetical protein VCHA37P203_260008 [Vibrio chagasii]|nr:hypothetical protein VCHA37P203_260008 [Vibrio chagasii]